MAKPIATIKLYKGSRYRPAERVIINWKDYLANQRKYERAGWKVQSIKP